MVIIILFQSSSSLTKKSSSSSTRSSRLQNHHLPFDHHHPFSYLFCLYVRISSYRPGLFTLQMNNLLSLSSSSPWAIIIAVGRHCCWCFSYKITLQVHTYKSSSSIHTPYGVLYSRWWSFHSDAYAAIINNFSHSPAPRHGNLHLRLLVNEQDKWAVVLCQVFWPTYLNAPWKLRTKAHALVKFSLVKYPQAFMAITKSSYWLTHKAHEFSRSKLAFIKC